MLMGDLCCDYGVCWDVVCIGVCLFLGGWGMYSMGQVSKGVFLTYLWFVM